MKIVKSEIEFEAEELGVDLEDDQIDTIIKMYPFKRKENPDEDKYVLIKELIEYELL